MKTYVMSADKYGCGYYRLIWPSMSLINQGHDVVIVDPSSRDSAIQGVMDGDTMVDVQIPEDADLMVFQRVTHKQIAHAMQLIRKRGVAVVVDFDDDLSSIHPANPAFNFMHPKGSYPDHSWLNAVTAADSATITTVATPRLLQRYGKTGNGRVFDNYVPSYMLDIPHADSDVIGWPGSVHSHPDDLQVMGNAPSRLARDGFTLAAIGDGKGVREAWGLPESVPVHASGVVDLQQWGHAVTKLGVGVAPLADTIFNASKCLDAETRVASQRGLIPIAELTTNDKVWHDGRWVRVEATSVEPPTLGLELVMKSGRRLKLTPNHKLSRGSDGWVQAQDLRVGDLLDMTPDEIGQSETQSAPWPSEGRMSRREDADHRGFLIAEDVPKVAISERWGRFLGLYAGDGCASGTQIVISCDGQDQDLIDLISDDLRQMGLYPSTDAAYTWSGEALRSRYVATSSAHFLRFLRELGVVERDRVRRIVTIPEIIWRSPKNVVAAYLAGLFEADGCASSTGVSLTTKHHDFALQVQRLLLGFGIESRVSLKRNRAKAGDPKLFISYQVSLRRAGADVFEREIGFLSSRKKARLAAITVKGHSNAYRPMTWTDEILSITPSLLSPVDIQVEGQVFAAAGFVSHNSWLKMAEMAAVGVPCVGSPRAEYSRLHKMGVGWLAKDQKDWYRKLKTLATNEQARYELAAQGREVMASMTIEANAWKLAEIWQEAVRLERGHGHNRKPGKTALGADLPAFSSGNL